MNGVIYVRYSSDNQREESIEGQLRECKEFARHNDIQIVDSYIDRALSARTDNRPAFQQMIKDSAKNNFEVVIVWKLDRFARNRYDSANYKAKLRKNGVKVISATETISNGAEGILLESMLEGYAEYYSAELSEKVRRGLTENALKCKFNGGMLPIGYIVDENQYIQIDPTTAPVVLDAFQHYADGATMKDIVNEMNMNGIRSIHGAKMNINTVTRMLHNRKYIGEYKHGEVAVPGGMPAIVTEELFEKVQERAASNKKAPAKHKAEDEYLLTTKLYCGKCKRFMVGECGTSKGNNKTYRYYKCSGAKKYKDCKKKPVKKEWIEDLVIESIKKIIFNDEVIDNIANSLVEAQKKENTVLPLLQKDYAEIQKGIDNLVNAIQMGIVTASTKERLESLEKQRTEISIRISQEELRHPTITKEEIVFWIKRFRDLNTNNLSHRRRLIDSFINSIYLYDDKMVITFNYCEGTETITFDEINAINAMSARSDLTSSAAPIKRSSDFRAPFYYCTRLEFSLIHLRRYAAGRGARIYKTSSESKAFESLLLRQ